MRSKIAVLLMTAMLFTGCRFFREGMPALEFPPEHLVSTAASVEPTTDLLERARRATFAVAFPQHRKSGTAVLIGRKALTPDRFRYQVATARHVVSEFVGNPRARRTAMVMFQPSAHGKPLRMKITINKITHSSFNGDWAVFTFDSKHKLDYAEIATKEEFQSIKPFETIYAVANEGGFGQLCRRGVMGGTHVEHMHLKAQQKFGSGDWMSYPHLYFRPFIQAWYGASGGGIFNKEGKLIGLINGSVIGVRRGVVTHAVAATKTYFILEQLNAKR